MKYPTPHMRLHLLANVLLMFIVGCAMPPPSSSIPIGAVPSAVPGAPVPPMTLPRYLGLESFAMGARRVVYRSRVRMSGVMPFVAPQPAAAAPVAICDPACMQSPAPAVATAAAIQQAEATAPAKVQALGFLATQNMCRNPQVEEAFLAAMDDPSESVRIAAVDGILKGRDRCGCSNACQSCCTAAVQAKLQLLAYAMDEQGCWCESSAKVRRLARRAACSCQPSAYSDPLPQPEEFPSAEVLEMSRIPATM